MRSSSSMNALDKNLWPWNEAALNVYKEMVEFSSFYPVSGPGQSPYGSHGATELVLKMHKNFEKLAQASSGTKIPVEEAMSYASMYRKIISQTTEQVCQRAHSSEEAFYADSLIVADTVWGLVESILIRPTHNSIVADLIEWVNASFGQARELLAEIEAQSSTTDRVEDLNIFWAAVISLILVGQFRSAASVLSLASDARHNLKIQRMLTLLQLFDVENLNSPSKMEKFLYARKQVLKQMDAFADDQPLFFIAKMLTGDIDTFKQAAASFSRPWYELLPAFILFSNPAASTYDLGDLTMELYNAIGLNAPNSNGFINNFILSIMKLNWMEALNDLAAIKSLLWLSVHLFDLILRIDDSRLTAEIQIIRDTVFITYANELFRTRTTPKLIPCAVSYAFETKDYKFDFVEPYLILIAENDGLKSSEMVSTLMTLCKQYGLFKAYHEITLALACISLRVKDWSKALYWALENESIEVMETIAFFVLLNASPAAIKTLTVFAEERENINQSDAMRFLLHFHQYNIALENRDVPKATSLLHDLIITNLAPPEFFHVLFDNIADVIDATNRCLDKEPLLNSEAITKLQRCLTMFQTQEEIRLQGSARRFDHYGKVDKKLASLHAVLLNALALTTLKK